MAMVDDDPRWVERFERRKDEERAPLGERYPQLVTFVRLAGVTLFGGAVFAGVIYALRYFYP
jgi:hypothetical protein